MTDHKKKGDLQRASAQSEDLGGNKKDHAKPESNSRMADKQNAVDGSRHVGTYD